MDIQTVYEDNNVLVINKPTGFVVFPEGQTKDNTIIDVLIEKYPDLKSVGEAPRYGIVHRLDKDTSGILVVAKSTEALIFLQKQFKNRTVEKKYIALVNGDIKDNSGTISTLIGRSSRDARKQRVYNQGERGSDNKREAITEYKVIERREDKEGNKFTLLEVKILTGRRHQIRCHFSYILHPIVGDKMYGFKNQPIPEGLNRQFLHAAYLKIQLPDGSTHEFNSDLPDDLKQTINNLKICQ